MWYARDIIMAMQFARANLNHLLTSTARLGDYNPDASNLCMAFLDYSASSGGGSDMLLSYSDDKRIFESLRNHLQLVSDLFEALPDDQRFGCEGMWRYHTEPKLLITSRAHP
jgi:hypothetical protein